MDVTLRVATAADAGAIARLHAESWRRTYRGIYSDDFLDNDVVDDRLRSWRDRLVKQPDARRFVLLASVGDALCGFICVEGDEDKRMGSLIDNLHVAPNHHRSGIGRILMRGGGRWLADNYERSGVYLKVLTGNANAIRFYEALSGSREGPVTSPSADGALVSTYHFRWECPAALVAGCERQPA